MIDHVHIPVTDIDTASAFSLAALRPPGRREIGYYRASAGPENVPDLFGIGDAVHLSTRVG